MEKRTEEQKIFHDPIVVKFGGKEFEVNPLVIKDSRAWRKKVWEVIVKLPQTTKVSSAQPDKFEAAMESMLVSIPDTVVDLFFDYARGLDKEEIEGIATDAEMAVAWKQVTEIAFPLMQGLMGTMGMMTPPTKKPQ